MDSKTEKLFAKAIAATKKSSAKASGASSNYQSALKRINEANSVEALKRLEKSFERIYNAGQFTPNELAKLDDKIMVKLARIDGTKSGVHGMKSNTKKNIFGAKRASVHGKIKDVYEISELANLFDLPEWDSLVEKMDFSHAYDYAYREALNDGMDESEAEEKAMNAQMEEESDYYIKWLDAVESTAEEVFGKIGIELDAKKPQKGSKRPTEYKIVPKKDWRTSAEEIRELVNGIGYFTFSSLKEFLDSGPYTAREAVLTHLHHANSYGEVYGDSSPKQIYDRHIR